MVGPRTSWAHHWALPSLYQMKWVVGQPQGKSSVGMTSIPWPSTLKNSKRLVEEAAEEFLPKYTATWRTKSLTIIHKANYTILGNNISWICFIWLKMPMKHHPQTNFVYSPLSPSVMLLWNWKKLVNVTSYILLVFDHFLYTTIWCVGWRGGGWGRGKLFDVHSNSFPK